MHKLRDWNCPACSLIEERLTEDGYVPACSECLKPMDRVISWAYRGNPVMGAEYKKWESKGDRVRSFTGKHLKEMEGTPCPWETEKK